MVAASAASSPPAWRVSHNTRMSLHVRDNRLSHLKPGRVAVYVAHRITDGATASAFPSTHSRSARPLSNATGRTASGAGRDSWGIGVAARVPLRGGALLSETVVLLPLSCAGQHAPSTGQPQKWERTGSYRSRTGPFPRGSRGRRLHPSLLDHCNSSWTPDHERQRKRAGRHRSLGSVLSPRIPGKSSRGGVVRRKARGSLRGVFSTGDSVRLGTIASGSFINPMERHRDFPVARPALSLMLPRRW